MSTLLFQQPPNFSGDIISLQNHAHALIIIVCWYSQTPIKRPPTKWPDVKVPRVLPVTSNVNELLFSGHLYQGIAATIWPSR